MMRLVDTMSKAMMRRVDLMIRREVCQMMRQLDAVMRRGFVT